MWDVEFSDEFGRWWQTLDQAEQESLTAGVHLLRQMVEKVSTIVQAGQPIGGG